MRRGPGLLGSRAGRRVLFGALYLSEGAPIGFVWWYLPTRLRAEGVPIESITALTAALVLPWTLKFLWAPLVDAWRARGGTYRAWIAVAQVLMVATLAPLPMLDLGSQFGAVTLLLLLHAVAAATQDVAVDGLAVATTAPGERGAVNGVMQAGMLLGRSVFGGAALVVAGSLGPSVVPGALIAVVASALLLLAFAGDERAAAMHPAPASNVVAVARAVLRRRETWFALGFALVSGAGFEGVGAVAGPFLVDRGWTAEAVGRFLAVPAVGAMLVGGILGGLLADRLLRRQAVAFSLVAIAALVFALAAATGAGHAPSIPWLLGGVYLGIGLFVASSYALFMDLTDPRLGATQFSAAMAATNACESWATFAVGRLAGALGYGPAFALLAAASLAGLALLPGMRPPPPEPPAPAGEPR